MVNHMGENCMNADISGVSKCYKRHNIICEEMQQYDLEVFVRKCSNMTLTSLVCKQFLAVQQVFVSVLMFLLELSEILEIPCMALIKAGPTMATVVTLFSARF